MNTHHRTLLLQSVAGLLLTTSSLQAQEPLPGSPRSGVTMPEEGLPGETPLPPEVPADPVPAEIPIETALPNDPAAAPSTATQQAADLEYMRQFSITNAETRTGFHSATGNADRYFEGFSGVPHPSFSDLLPLSRPTVFEMRVGPLKVRPSITTGVNVTNYRRTDARTEVEGVIAASLAAELGEPLTGRFLSSNYGIGYLFGENRHRPNKVDQALSVLGEYDFEKLRLGVSISYSQLSGVDREFTRGTQRQLLTASFTSSYQMTEKTILDFDVTLPVTQYTDGVGSGGVTLTAFLNYAFSPKTLIGLGGSVGYLNVDNADAQTFEQVLVRVLSTMNPFITYYGTAGVDFRDYGPRSVVHPVFALGGSWTPREGTSFSLAAEQRVQNSTSVSQQDFLSTNVTLGAAQRLGADSILSLTFGFEHATYESVQPGVSADRTDDTFFGQLALSTALTRHCTVVGSLTYRDTESNISPQTYEQAGLHVTYNF